MFRIRRELEIAPADGFERRHDEIGDGPVLMKTFSKPFHELGGLFIDFKANRARPLTVRNNIGIQIISATDPRKQSAR